MITPDSENLNRIVILNPKGGCGKTTLTTNLVSAYAGRGTVPVVMDCDPQGSTMCWLGKRPTSRPPIHGIAAFKRTMHATRSWQLRVPNDATTLIIASPAGVSHDDLRDLTRDACNILVPVLPSSIDIHAASRCIADLLLVAKAILYGPPAHEVPEVIVEGAPLFLQREKGTGVSHCRLHLQLVADDARIREQALDYGRGEPGDLSGIETEEGPSVVFPLVENRAPAQAGLGPFEDQELEEHPVIVHRNAPFPVVIGDVEGIVAGPGAALQRAHTALPIRASMATRSLGMASVSTS